MNKIAKFKVQKIGNSLYLCLPKIWAQDVGIQKSKFIELFLDENQNLILKPVKE